MKYSDLGLINTKDLFADALTRKYAVPAFNFYNMETLNAILSAANTTNSPVILAVSESAIKYMGEKTLMGMIYGQNLTEKSKIVLHLDHGSSIDSCKHAIDLGFSSVMIDASKMDFQNNINTTKSVVEYAHKYNVSVEGELGVLSGIEDETTHSTQSLYTNPNDVINFVNQTNVDSLAIAIGTSHGAYKRKSENEKLRFDILEQIAEKLPHFPLVLHGASSIPQKFLDQINTFGGNMSSARGIPTEQLKQAVSMNICKINVDSDSRLAFTGAIREYLTKNPEKFNPRDYLSCGKMAIYENCIDEIQNIMNSANKI